MSQDVLLGKKKKKRRTTPFLWVATYHDAKSCFSDPWTCNEWEKTPKHLKVHSPFADGLKIKDMKLNLIITNLVITNSRL
jgi:hypothetical protein